MQFATKTALFYVASNRDHNLHYPHFPVGPDSWCKYNQDHANGPTKSDYMHQNMTILKQQRSKKIRRGKAKTKTIKMVRKKDNLMKQVHSKT